MHLVRYRLPGSPPQVGIHRDDTIVPVTAVESMSALLRLPYEQLRATVESAAGDPSAGSVPAADVRLLAPLDGRTEVWCAGVTYERSRGARMEESSEESIYDRVYRAARPELFLKSPAWRLVTDTEPIGIRADSGHDVPEPELAVVVNAGGSIVGYTVCDDVSSRSLEGENPLYIPQAKVFAGGCALATGIRPAWEVPDPTALTIRMAVRRDGAEVFAGETSTSQLARPLEDLVAHLCGPNDFPDGVALATGTGIVPEFEFALRAGDEVEIEIEQVGRMVNAVAVGTEPFEWLAEESATVPVIPARPVAAATASDVVKESR